MPDHSTALAHQFDDIEQQHESASLGMWIFLATEIMFFGALFLGYSVYRGAYHSAYAEASRHLDVVLGGINTGVLLCSSLTMALAVHAAQLGGRRTVVALLIATILLGSVFLGIKAVEYTAHFREKSLPGKYYAFEEVKIAGAAMFFSLYFIMTGLHGLHVVAGMSVLSWLLWRTLQGRYSSRYYTGLEMGGLYWHLVDLVWIFLYPLLYLI